MECLGMNASLETQLPAEGTAASFAAALSSANIALARRTAAAKLEQAVKRVACAAVDSGDIPGVVAQVWREGETCCDVAAGMRDRERQLPMDHSTLFGIASMTKPVTVALALRLVDEGKLRLDSPITRWMPEFAQMRVLRRPDGPLEDTVPAERAITVEDLMTHRAGLAFGFLTPPPLGAALLARVGMGIDSDLTPDAWLQRLSELPLVFQPGERFNYGHSIDVLGFLAARVLGRDLASAMHEKLFAPLGMVDTGFWIPPEKRSRMATSYASPGPGEFIPSNVRGFTADRPSECAFGGQGLVSTAADYLRFARMLMNEGKLDRVRVLKAETVRAMRSNRITAEQRKFPFVAGAPFNQGFGLGMAVVIDSRQWGVVSGGTGAFGWPGAFGGWWQADPGARAILLWLQQCTPAPPQAGAALPRCLPGQQGLMQFRKTVYDSINGESHANLVG
jgi:CubicO group peptidase (beta-lactamase class C family)